MAEDKKREKKKTIYDIASEAGVSPATVSRVLSNSGYPVRESVRRKILSTAERLNYSPNIIGRMLKKSESTDIGVIIPTISNPFYSQVVLGIELEARKRGYSVLLCNSFRDSETEKKYIRYLYQKQVGGIILPNIEEDHPFIKEMQGGGLRLAAFEQYSAGLGGIKIGFDYEKGVQLAVEHLIAMGHRNIAFLSAPLHKKSRIEMLEGYKGTLSRHGIPLDEGRIILSETEEEYDNGSYEFENGKRLAAGFMELKMRPTAIFAINDITAIGIIQELSNNGVNVPEDVSVVGFDNIEFSSMSNPPLTTVNQPSYEIGKLACRMLIDSIIDGNQDSASIKYQPTLVVRKSVKNMN